MKTLTIITYLLCALFSFTNINLFGKVSDYHYVFAQNTSISNHFFIKEDSADTKASESLPTSSDDINGEQYTVQQDSNFFRDSRLSISFMYWLKKGLNGSEALWADMMRRAKNLPSNALSTSFALMPSNVFEPTSVETVQYQIDRINALSIPGVHTFSDGGIQFNMRDMAVLMGLAEDVSPKIVYTLTRLADVEIVIYSVGAVQVATIFAGTQKAGKYTLYWNGKDSTGKRAPSGDYIAEVRVGHERFVRKRIVIE